MRGTGVAVKLIREMENFLGNQNEGYTYYILTEKDNICANKFYSKIGAELITASTGTTREINRWHKTLK